MYIHGTCMYIHVISLHICNKKVSFFSFWNKGSHYCTARCQAQFFWSSGRQPEDRKILFFQYKVGYTCTVCATSMVYIYVHMYITRSNMANDIFRHKSVLMFTMRNYAVVLKLNERDTILVRVFCSEPATSEVFR